VTSHDTDGISTPGRTLSHIPEVRQKQISRIKRMVSEGTYRVDSRKVAQGILKNALTLRLLINPR